MKLTELVTEVLEKNVALNKTIGNMEKAEHMQALIDRKTIKTKWNFFVLKMVYARAFISGASVEMVRYLIKRITKR